MDLYATIWSAPLLSGYMLTIGVPTSVIAVFIVIEIEGSIYWVRAGPAGEIHPKSFLSRSQDGKRLS